MPDSLPFDSHRAINDSASSVSRVYRGPMAETPERSFLEDVLEGLAKEPKSLPCKYFYDEVGSALFDEICELPEYYPTRTELAIMREHVTEMARAIGPQALLVELGSGSSTKTRLLLEALESPTGYVPVDISGEHLLRAAQSIRDEFPGLVVEPVSGDFTRSFELPEALCEAARHIVVYFPGSTIGNFTTEEAETLLQAVAKLVGRGGALLIGADLVKATDVLERAYDDTQGVTARFNLNLLARANRELGANFELDAFRHVAVYDEEAARIEISIESLREQQVELDGQSFGLRAGEQILTEYSHKYTLERFEQLAGSAGFEVARVWTDPEERFSVQYLQLT